MALICCAGEVSRSSLLSDIPITIRASAFPARRHARSKANSLLMPSWQWNLARVLSMAFAEGSGIRPRLDSEIERSLCAVWYAASCRLANEDLRDHPGSVRCDVNPHAGLRECCCENVLSVRGAVHPCGHCLFG